MSTDGRPDDGATAPRPQAETTQALIARLWDQFRPLARDRVEAIAEFVDRADADAPSRATATAQERARRAAHDLAGSLGSYGRPRGSELARAIETAVLADPPDLAAARAAVAELRTEVG